MRGRGVRRSAKPTTVPQLDLFAPRDMAGPVGPQIPETGSQAVASQPRPPLDVLLSYLRESRKRGRPEKALSFVAAEDANDRRLLDVRAAALWLGLSKSTLDKMRCSGRGPRFIRATDRAIRYDPVDLQAFADERRRRSTSEVVAMMAE